MCYLDKLNWAKADNKDLGTPRAAANRDVSELSDYYAMAAERREKILDSETSIVKSDTFIPGEAYTGTAYYVSSSDGDDNNDGLPPVTPWKTLFRVHQRE